LGNRTCLSCPNSLYYLIDNIIGDKREKRKKEKEIFKFKKWSLSITKDKCDKVLKFDQHKCQKQMCDLGQGGAYSS
jgi:hypothetical protein